MAAIGRGRAAGPAAHLQQRGGGEGAVPHARGQSTQTVLVLTINIQIIFTGIPNFKCPFYKTTQTNRQYGHSNKH